MIISIISSVIVWGAAAVLLLRILKFSGIGTGGGFFSFLTEDLRLKSVSGGEYTAARVFIAALIFRAVVFLFEALVLMIFDEQEFTFSSFLRRLEIWDCTNYVRIAENGYSGFNIDGKYSLLVFLPLYPYTAKIINLIINNTHISLLLTSALAYAGGCVFLYKTCVMDYGHSTAKKAVIYTSIFPFAFFFGAMMNESMLFFTTAMTLYFTRRHKWLSAGISGALAALSRMAGILVIIPAAVEWFESCKISEKLKNREFKTVWRLFYSKALFISIMLAGFGVYLVCNYAITGSFFKFLEYDAEIWGQKSVYFGSCINQTAVKAFDFSDRQGMLTMWLPYLSVIILCAAAIIYGMRRNRSMYTAYFIAYLIMNTSLSYPISGCRYMSCIIPLFIFTADFSERHKAADRWITVIFSILFGVYLTAYLHDMII